MRSESCSFIWHPKVVTWKRFMHSRVVARVVGRARLPDHGDLDLAGVLELLLDLARDLVREQHGAVVVERAGDDHHADLAAGLHRVDLVDALVAGGDPLEVAQALDVLLERLAAGAGAGARERVGGLHDHGLDGLRLDLVVVGLHRVRDRLGLAVAAGEVAADERVRALDLVRDGLADVVQQRRAAGGLGGGAELVGHHRRQVRALDGVREHVLAVARAVLQAAQDLDQLGVEAADVGLEGRLLAALDDVALELGLGLVVGLLDPRRVDAPVLQQLLERHPGDLAADAVEAGEDHRVRRVVDDEVDAGEVLERADVAALAADDAALHVVGGQLDDRDGRLGGVAGGEPLHDDGEDVAHAPVGVALGLLLDLAHAAARESWRICSSSSLSRWCLAWEARHARRALELAHEVLALARELLLARRERLARRSTRLRAARAPPRGRAGAPPGGRSPRCARAPRCRRAAACSAFAARAPAALRCDARARAWRAAARPTTRPAARPKATTTAAITISISVSSPPPRTAGAAGVSP